MQFPMSYRLAGRAGGALAAQGRNGREKAIDDVQMHSTGTANGKLKQAYSVKR